MATTAGVQTGALMIALQDIHLPANVREVKREDVDALAGSIRLVGVLVPVIVAANDEPGPEAQRPWKLVAGFTRYAAALQEGLAEIPATVRDSETDVVDRGVENIARRQLDAYEEAVAVKAMLDKGLSEEGAAQALGWPRQRVAARMKLLELPERAQKLAGQGVIPLSAVDHLRAIATVSKPVLDAVVEHVADPENGWSAERLASDPGRVVGDALRHSKTFGAWLNTVDRYDIQELKLGKKADALFERVAALHKQIDRYAYGAPTIRFGEQDVDQARAAGVLLELGRSAPMITDRPLYRELCKGALKRTVEELEAKLTRLAEERKATKSKAQPVDPQAEARREHGRRTRQIAEQAHGANLDLGWALMNNLATVDPADMAVARFFTHALLGADHDGSAYSQQGERVMDLAMRGIRLVIEEFRTDVTKTRKDGTRGALRISYGDPRKPEKPIAWLWRFIDAAQTAGELYGRTLVVIAAEQYASRLVLPVSQQHPAMRWPSHKGHALKALTKLAGPHLPATLKQLEKAIAKVNADRDAHTVPSRTRRAAAPVANDARQQDDVAGEQPDDGELAEDATAENDAEPDGEEHSDDWPHDGSEDEYDDEYEDPDER